jgi:uroporphyrinogen-III synthase
MSDLRIHLLSTGSLSDALIDTAAAKGIGIDAISFIATDPVGQPALEGLLDRPLTAVFTSSNAVKAIGDSGGRDWKIYCVGKMAARRFGENAIADSAGSAKELAEKIIRKNDECEIYFFCGDRRRDELPEMLRKDGFIVHEITVYRTIATPHRVTRSYDGISFYSPSAVDSFFSANTVAPEIPLFAIGNTTAEAIRLRCSNPVVVGSRQNPDKEDLIRLMIEYFHYE